MNLRLIYRLDTETGRRDAAIKRDDGVVFILKGLEFGTLTSGYDHAEWEITVLDFHGVKSFAWLQGNFPNIRWIPSFEDRSSRASEWWRRW